ncbi:DUF6670 family protein [Gordonia sp. VNK21]|uniref:DUF6670 family protein n=1 Tax=Gordonia sp. VNK21 TaxID=3382483 RepID=UPI0038D3D4DF
MVPTVKAMTAAAVVRGLRPLVDSRARASRQPYDGDWTFPPYVGSRRFAWTHFGVFVPGLPEPLRYLNIMTLVGSTGTELFDNGTLAADDVRQNSTVLASTAAPGHHHYRAYDVAAECGFAPDGSSLTWDDDLTLTVGAHAVSVRGRFAGFSVELDLTPTDEVSYFVRTGIYDHLSLLAPYRGQITDARTGETTAADGLATFEYARCAGPQSLIRRAVPRWAQLPVDFFTYQIIDLDAETQVLLTEVLARGAVALRAVHVRVRGGRTEMLDDVDFGVHRYGPQRLDPEGRPMRIPERMRWTARRDGATVLSIEATVHPVLRYGHGHGYAGSYDYRGTFEERDVAGIGYLEWIDLQEFPLQAERSARSAGNRKDRR